MSKALVFFTFFALLGTNLILLAGCASSLLKEADTGIVNGNNIDIDNKKEGGRNPTKTVIANKAKSLGKSEAGSSDKQAKPDLSGSWILNKVMSDNAQEKIKTAMQQRRTSKGDSSSGRAGFGRGGRRGGDMKGAVSFGGQGGKRGSLDSSFQELKALLSVSDTLVLTHKDPMLLIVTDGGRKQRIFTDNRGVSVSVSGGFQQKVTTAGWENDILVVETTSNGGSRLIQHYNLTTEPRQLLLGAAIQLPGLSKAILINLVYEPANVPLN